MIKQSNIQLKLNYPTVAGIVMMVIHLGAIADVQASSDADYNFLINSDWHNCQQISTDYQEVYAFETPSFHINICQKDHAYFYSGEAKQSNTSSMFIPATPLKHGHGFQAKNGNVAYVVILPFPEAKNLEPSAFAPEKAILKIKRNDELVTVESSLHKYCRQSEGTAIANFANAFEHIKLNYQAFNQLAMIPQPQDFGRDLFSSPPANILLGEIFHTNSRFDFYRLDGELHRLHTCS
jgi:ribosomal protein L31